MSFLPDKATETLHRLWRRRSVLGALTLYLAAVEVLLLVLRGMLRLLRSNAAGTLNGWISFTGFLLAAFLLILVFVWIRRKLMWRLRNRLIVTYVFIGVIPVVLLVAIGVIAAYLFAGQFATFVVTSDLQTELRALEAANTAAAESIANRLTPGVAPATALPPAAVVQANHPHRTLTLWAGAKSYTVPANAPVIAEPPKNGAASRAIAGDPSGLYLRAWSVVRARGEQYTLISSVPLGQDLLQRIGADVGEVTLYAPDFSSEPRPAGPEQGLTIKMEPDQRDQPHGSVVIRQGDNKVFVGSGEDGKLRPALAPIVAGALPPPKNRLDREVMFGMPFNVVHWKTGDTASTLMRVRTRPSLLYHRLFSALGEFAGLVLYVLIAVGVVFALIEFVALITGIRLTRTMTSSVAALYTATQHINRGDLSHRIQVKSEDQLAALESSFNSMTESLEKLIAEQKEKQRMESELAIAQEVQAQLFPQTVTDLSSLEMFGVCRPARTVSGDYYDFLPLGPEKLGIAVGDISGKGISAALLMATIHSAVRVYEFGRVPVEQQLVAAGAAAVAVASGSTILTPAGAIDSPAAVLTLLNRHLFHSTPAEKYATLFLGLWNGTTRTLSYSNGGHLPPIIVHQDGSIRKLGVGGMVIGLLDNMQYDEADVELLPGDLFVAYSDGVTEPENEFGEFGEHRLIELVKENRHLPLARIGEAVTGAVADWIGAQEQPDDITLVLARAK